MKFPGVLAFVLGISKGSDAILWNFQGLSFVLSGISRGKEKKKKNSRGFSKKYVLNPPCLVFFRNSLMSVGHKNFLFTPIPDKPNDLIFFQKSKRPVFESFLTIFSHFVRFIFVTVTYN